MGPSFVRRPSPLFRHKSEFDEWGAQFSQDGRWIVYVSNETGQPEIYIQSFPSGDKRRPISVDSGHSPRWSRGNEIFFLTNNSKMMAAAIPANPAEGIISPQVLFDAAGVRDYDVSADGQHFLLNTVLEKPQSPHITVTVNWPALPKK